MLVIAVVIAGVIAFFGEMVFRIFFQNMLWGGRRSSREEGKGGAGIAIVIALAIIAVVWVLSIVIRFALSRQREYLADAGSVELTKNPDAMISALRKIEGRGEIPGANSAVMEMCIDNPREGFSNIFDTHPAVDKRVEALVKFAGGHDSGPLALPGPDDAVASEPPPGGPWGGDAPQQAAAPSGPWAPEPGPNPPGPSGPWGPPRN
jgi:heat shock protein HtpX